MLGDMSTYLKNKLLDHLRGTAYTAPTTLYLAALKTDLTEVGTAVAGAPSSTQYNRATLTLNAAASGKATNNGAVTITMPSGLAADTKVPYVAIFDAQTAGNALWYLPATLSRFEATVTASTDTFETKETHGFSADDRVILDDLGASLPAGLSPWTTPTAPYFVLSSGLTTTQFKISTTSGGSAVDITADGGCLVRKLNVQGFNASQQLQIADATLTIALAS